MFPEKTWGEWKKKIEFHYLPLLLTLQIRQPNKKIQACDEIQIPLEIETLTTKSKWKIKTKQKFLNPYFLENQMSGERSQSS